MNTEQRIRSYLKQQMDHKAVKDVLRNRMGREGIAEDDVETGSAWEAASASLMEGSSRSLTIPIREHCSVSEVGGRGADDKSYYEEDGSDIDPVQFDRFKEDVRIWSELDMEIKRLQAAVRQRRKTLQELGAKIQKFMDANDIEDLNTKDCIIRYKSKIVKETISSKNFVEKLCNNFENEPAVLDKIKALYEQRPDKTKVALRRIRY